MPLVTVRLDRVFDVVHTSAQEKAITLLSIETGGRAHYGLELPGKQTFQDGIVVTALLERDGDWGSILAWRDHATGNIVRRSSLWEDAPLFIAACLGMFAFVAWQAAPLLSLLLGAATVGMLLWQKEARIRRNSAVEQMLNSAESP